MHTDGAAISEGCVYHSQGASVVTGPLRLHTGWLSEEGPLRSIYKVYSPAPVRSMYRSKVMIVSNVQTTSLVAS